MPASSTIAFFQGGDAAEDYGKVKEELFPDAPFVIQDERIDSAARVHLGLELGSPLNADGKTLLDASVLQALVDLGLVPGTLLVGEHWDSEWAMTEFFQNRVQPAAEKHRLPAPNFIGGTLLGSRGSAKAAEVVANKAEAFGVVQYWRAPDLDVRALYLSADAEINAQLGGDMPGLGGHEVFDLGPAANGDSQLLLLEGWKSYEALEDALERVIRPVLGELKIPPPAAVIPAKLLGLGVATGGVVYRVES